MDFSTGEVAETCSKDDSYNSEIELQPLTSEAVNETGGRDSHAATAREDVPSNNKVIPRCLLLTTIAVSISVAIASTPKLVVSSQRSGISDGAPHRPKFIRFYSTGHCGTRFLTEIFMTNAVLSDLRSSQYHHLPSQSAQTADQHHATSLYWNEDNLYLGPYTKAANLSLSHYQQHIGINRFLPTIHKADLDIDTTCLHRFDRNCHATVDPGRVYKDDLTRLELKSWNRHGNTTELEHYLVDSRVPRLAKIVNYFGPKDGLNQMVKFGHTHIFYDLSTYHKALSKEFDLKWVRIRRKRVNVARSFAQDNGGKRPDPCIGENGVVVCPWDEMSILKPSRDAWDGWTVFMQHIWFVDEVEARWRTFLKSQKGGTDMEIFTLKFQDDTDTINPSDIDELAVFMNVDSPREIMSRMPKLSHISGDKMDASVMEAEALRYAKEAPWCSQNVLESPVDFVLDCSPNAY